VAYSATTWVESSTTVGPTNLNKLETAATKMPYGPDFSSDNIPVWNGSAWVSQKVTHSQMTVPSARVYGSANQSIADSSTVALAFNSERYDTDSMHDTATNNTRLTCNTTGTYSITGSVQFAANATGRRLIQVRINGATVIATAGFNTVSGSFNTDIVVTTDYQLSATDYVELVAFQNSGGALNVLATSNYSPEFMIKRVA